MKSLLSQAGSFKVLMNFNIVYNAYLDLKKVRIILEKFAHAVNK